MGIWRSALGDVRIQITSADFPESLKNLTARGIKLRDVVCEDDLSVSVTVGRMDCKSTVRYLEAKGDHCRILHKNGLFWTIIQMQKRPALVLGLLFMIFLSVFIPSKVFFIQVRGNQAVPAKLITENVQKAGMFFGCDRKSIQSERMKNEMIESIPQLDWVGITTSGCVATVEVKEKSSEEKDNDVKWQVSSLVASCDGVVESITATKGTALCKPGQVVRQGQVLISGYEDLGLVLKATNACGEVYARTQRFFQAVTPVSCYVRVAEKDVQTRYSVQIGKNQINFSQDSGISPASCVKMYDKKYITLPGGFRLPIALIVEKTIPCEISQQKMNEESFYWIESFSKKYTQSQMIAGKFIHEEISKEMLDALYIISAEYACREQIGQIRNEETIRQNGENG